MKAFSELTSASQVNNDDLLAISQTSGSGYASKKTTVKDITDISNLNLAEEYDNTSTYAVDDYVIYESVLYKCIGTTTGTFDSTKWTSVVVTDEMGSGGGGTGGHTIIDESGNSMTARAGLQFVGGANVSDDPTNNKTIVDLASAGGIDGVFIDTTNIIKQQTTITSSADVSYTATEDCCVFYRLMSPSNGNSYINLDGVLIYRQYANPGILSHNSYIFLKKGQTLLFHQSYSDSNGYYIVYGIQTGTTHSKFQPVIYSTEEREIGVWTDGKPLYEKTWDFGNDITCNSNSWTNTPITKGNIEKIVNIKAVNNAGTIWDMIGANTDQTYVQVYHNRGSNANISIRYATLQYTKSTDTAGSGGWTPQGVPAVHYSTDEQVIGTWIDGSTLYEKTITEDSISTGNNTISHGISNFGNLVNVIGTFKRHDGSQFIIPTVHASDVTWDIGLLDISTTSCLIMVGTRYTGDRAVDSITLTLQYTKASS